MPNPNKTSSETGESYTTAARALGDGGPATVTIDPVLLVPYPDETDVSIEELGWAGAAGRRHRGAAGPGGGGLAAGTSGPAVPLLWLLRARPHLRRARS